MSRRLRRAPEEPKTETLNMTPMIDVVFQLLIFFMLSMHFKEVEGQLISQLPKDKGTAPNPVDHPDLRELRVFLSGDGDVCSLRVEGHPAGELRHGRTEANRALYRAAGEKLRELYSTLPAGAAGRPAPVIIDVDRRVPYEHVIGVVNACKAVKIEHVEFAAPRPPGP